MKKSRNGDTLGPVELIIWPEQGNKGDWREQDGQDEVFIIIGEISSEIDRSSLCDIEKSSFKCFEIGLKMIVPTQVHTQRITKTLLGPLPDL